MKSRIARISVLELGEGEFRLVFHGSHEGEPALLIPVDGHTARAVAIRHNIEIQAFPLVSAG